jgi:hypothetical protein
MTYSREHLRARSAIMRKDFLKSSVERYIQPILDAATKGATSYTIALQNDNRGGILVQNLQGTMTMCETPPTMEELREALLEIFPDSIITCKESWINMTDHIKGPNPSITVDWS